MNPDPYALPETPKVEVKDPKDFLKAVYLDVNLTLSVRMRAAIELMPYIHPKLAVTAVVTEHDFATLLDRGIANFERIQNGEMIEHKPAPQVEVKPQMPRVADRRFRRI